MNNNRLFIIYGKKDGTRRSRASRAGRRLKNEPNLDVLKRSPCLDCDLYSENAVCPHVSQCGKIDEFQRVATVHCTLFKDQDIHSILKL